MNKNDSLELPINILPQDGRFGAGPSKVFPENATAVATSKLMGTSHRQRPVKNLVKEIQKGLFSLFSLPEGYEVVLGNGGSTAFWDAASFSLVENKAQHLCFGEFGAKFGQCTKKAPFLADSEIITAEPGTAATVNTDTDADIIAWPHNETSTGVAMPVIRPHTAHQPLIVIDATSGAGGLAVDMNECDVYYFAPQKNFGADGGLWVAIMSPAALERVEKICASERWIPDFLNLKIAIDNSRLNQTYNTPALATLILLNEQVKWMNKNGGLEFCIARTKESSDLVYAWADKSKIAEAFVTNLAERSAVICTIDFDDSIDAMKVASVLRANGIVDVEPYRKLGRNQLRIATFAGIDPEDIKALLSCIDYIIEQQA